MKKIIFFSTFLFLILVSLIACTSGKSNLYVKADKARIQKLMLNDTNNSATGINITFIKDSNELEKIKKAFKDSKKSTDGSNYEMNDSNYYEITFYEKEKPLGIYGIWINKDWSKAVYLDRHYYYLDEAVTNYLKNIIFQNK